MSRFVGLMVVGLGLVGASNAMAFSTARPTAAQEQKIATNLTAAAKRSVAYKDLAKSGNKPIVKVTFQNGSTMPGFIGNGLLDANVTIYTKGAMLPGQKPGLVGREQRTYTVNGAGKNFKATADGSWGRLYQAVHPGSVGVDILPPSKKLMNQLTGTPTSVGGSNVN